MSEHHAEIEQAAERIRKLMEQNQTALEGGAAPKRPKPEITAILRKGGYPERHVKQLEAGVFGPGAEKAESLWPKIMAGDSLIFLIGDRGPGKTQMATCWAGRLASAGKSAGRYAKCADLIGEIKATWHDGGKSVGTEQDVLKKYRTAKYLVIDEFHEKGGSEWESRCLVNLLDHRYDDMLTTVLIANLSKAQVSEQINPSIISRAEQTGGLVNCDWASYRTKI